MENLDNLDATLSQLVTDLGVLVNDEPAVELREFANKREFLKYAQEQVVLAKADTDDAIMKARLEHLRVNTELAQKNFQDNSSKKLPLFRGPLSVEAQTAWKERSEKDISPTAAAASTQPGPKGFSQKNGSGSETETQKNDTQSDAVTMQSLLDMFTTLLDGPEASSKEDGQDADTPKSGTTEQPAVASSDEDGTDTTQKNNDPWGNGYDMNFKASDDPDEYPDCGFRGHYR